MLLTRRFLAFGTVFCAWDPGNKTTFCSYCCIKYLGIKSLVYFLSAAWYLPGICLMLIEMLTEIIKLTELSN